MKAVIQPLAWGLAMASMLALASGVALDVVVDTAQATVTHDGHGAHAAPPAGGEQQWATDAALREGMTRLRQAAEAALPDDPAQPISERQALALQKEVEDSVSYLIANCELSAQADAALHGLLADLLGGAKALAVPPSEPTASNGSTSRLSAIQACSPRRTGTKPSYRVSETRYARGSCLSPRANPACINTCAMASGLGFVTTLHCALPLLWSASLSAAIVPLRQP